MQKSIQNKKIVGVRADTYDWLIKHAGNMQAETGEIMSVSGILEIIIADYRKMKGV